MKPILIAVALFASTFTKSFAADGPAVQPTVLKSFQSTFASATEVRWTQTDEFYRAVFFLNGQYITAYYNTDGSMQAVTRHISATNLPVILQTSLKNKSNNLWVTDVLEVTTGDGVQYYTTLENADTKVILKSVTTSWNTYQKEKKE